MLWRGAVAGSPGTSSLNAGGGAYATSNGVTVVFGTGANDGKLSFSWQGAGSPQTCQIYLVVAAKLQRDCLPPVSTEALTCRWWPTHPP